MARAYGANASLLAAFESTYGSTPVDGYWQLPFVSTSLGSEQGLIANDLIGLGRDPSAPIRDVIKVEGDMVVPLDVRHIGLWLKALLGEPTSVGTGVVTHTFTSGKPSLPSLTLETGLPDIPAWFVASGVMVNSLQVGFARSGAANATVGLVAQGEIRRTATLIDAATNNTPLELTFGYAIDADHRLTFIAHEVYLPKPKLSISGPGGIQATFEWQAAKATSVARMFTVELVNDVSSY